MNWEDHSRLMLFTRNNQTQVLHRALKSSRGLCLHMYSMGLSFLFLEPKLAAKLQNSAALMYLTS